MIQKIHNSKWLTQWWFSFRTWRHLLVVCKMQCHLVVRKHILYPRFLFFRFLRVSRTCSDFGVKSWKPWEDPPSGTLWIYVAASSQVEPLAARIQCEGCLTSNANAAVICFSVTSCPVFSFEFGIMATLDTGPLNSHFQTTYARHRAQLQMFAVNDPLVCSRLQSAAGVCWLHSSGMLLHMDSAAQMRRRAGRRPVQRRAESTQWQVSC